jgi:hypothetical protein
MSDLGVVPVGFNKIVRDEYEVTGEVPSGPRSFVSSPSFEFYRDPKTNSIQGLSGTGLLASRVLYHFFNPIGSYALDTTKGSLIESLVGSNYDKPTLTVEIVRTIQKVEDDIKSTSEYIYSSNPDEELSSISLENIEFNSEGDVVISITIESQSGKRASLQVGV